jgi:chaperonin cofactor prefoldin
MIMWNPFNKYKMKAKELQQENEGLKARIAGLTFNSKQLEEKVQFLENEIQNIFKLKKELENEVNRLNMLLKTNNTNQNDSRYY